MTNALYNQPLHPTLHGVRSEALAPAVRAGERRR